MNRYIALLRGVNISGKNKLSMPALTAAFAARGYAEVSSYLNSGNLVFSCAAQDEMQISRAIEAMLREEFALEIPVFVLLQGELQALLGKKPAWWGTADKALYDNLIFVLPPTCADEIVEKVGEPTPGLEQIHVAAPYIFWSFDREKYAKCNWWKKTARAGIGERLTIRTANTLNVLATR
ncbi:MAG: DUF1697 domain-containing protein [Gemmiger sp.]|nr:DUF1697 domain-containing protein [Gemmiger sp.]